MAKDKVLVTGGAGFIGSHLTHALIARGAEVTVLDSFISGSREGSAEGVTVIEADVRDPDAVTRAMQGATKVVHLAALVSVTESMRTPLETHSVNVTGTANVFEAARTAGIERVVYASSAAVYGNEPTLPKREDMALAPLSPYALSKQINEVQAESYARIYGLQSIGLRFFNVYGPGQKGTHPYASVIPRWIDALKKKCPIEIYGDGTQTRDFIHVRDVAHALCLALSAPSNDATIYNIASGSEVSLLELLELMEESSESKIVPVLHPMREGDILRSIASVEVAKQALGFTASVPLPDGIRELLT